MSASAATENPRRHDLDALRAFAMLLGVLVHASLAFIPMPWPVRDASQSKLLSLGLAALHGFRMPVFFLMSGFFTAMLWRRRGLRSLLGHRARRIALPLALGMLTIIPATNWVVERAVESGVAQEVAQDPAKATEGPSPLIVAAATGDVDFAASLIESGIDLNARSDDQSTALHTAAFFGHAKVVELLVASGAEIEARNQWGQTPLQVTAVNWNTTEMIAGALQLELVKDEVLAGRQAAAKLLREGQEQDSPKGERFDKLSVALLRKAMVMPFFHHLWFLWFLCWLVPAFALYAHLSDRFDWPGPPRWMTLHPLRLLWLVPIAAVFQYMMGIAGPTFGADTSAGLLPMPHVLGYYAVFFGYGALYYQADDQESRVGRRWATTLLLAVLLVFPLAISLTYGPESPHEAMRHHSLLRVASAFAQVTFTWMVTLGLIGLFRRMLRKGSAVVRYLSDASYWIYLVHLPLVIAAQMMLRDWPAPLLAKLSLICIAVTAISLATYQAFVRNYWLGRLLNGRRAVGAVASEAR